MNHEYVSSYRPYICVNVKMIQQNNEAATMTEEGLAENIQVFDVGLSQVMSKGQSRSVRLPDPRACHCRSA